MLGKGIRILYSEGYCTIQVNNGVQREVTNPNMVEVLRGLHPDDLGAVVAFCKAVGNWADNPKGDSQFMQTAWRK